MKNKRLWAAAVLAAGLAACGGGKSGGGSTATPPTAETPTTPTDPTLPTPATPVSIAYVPLTLADGPAAARVPVRTGVPFPVGAVRNAAQLRLETAAGAETPAQVDVLVRWPDGSIKVALVQTVATLGAEAGYRVAYGTSVTRAALPRDIAVSGDAATGYTVDTGLVRVGFSTKGLAQRVWRLDGSTATPVITHGELYAINALDDKTYTASAAADASVTLEERGPLRVVLKSTGTFTVAGGTNPVKYLLRYELNQGSDKVDIEATVLDDRLETNVESVPATFAVALKGLGMRWTYAGAGASYRFGAEGGAAHAGTVSGAHYQLQTGKFRYADGVDNGHTFAYSGVGTGAKAPGWMAVDAGGTHLALMVRDFWQQFPNELRVEGDTVTAALFPERSITGAAQTQAPASTVTDHVRANTLYFARPGGAKTWQLRLAVGATAGSTDELTALNARYQRHRLELASTPAWYAASRVFGDLNPGGASTAATGYDAVLMHDIYEASIERSDGNATMYGWRDHGDRLRAGYALIVDGVKIPSFYNDTHVGANNFYTQFLRTGDARWFDLADIATRHFRDIDVSHGPRKGYWTTGTATTPAGEIHAISHENIDHQVRNLHWGHAHVSGLTDHWLLTGDRRSYDVLAEIAGWWKFVSPTFFKRPFAMADRYREAERDYGWPLYVMNEWVRATGDATYHKDVAGGLVDYLGQWFRTPAMHIGYNPATKVISTANIAMNDASSGTGWFTMTQMDNSNGVTKANGTNPWMAGAFLGNLIKFHEADALFAAAGQGSGLDRTQRVDMLLQAMNYVVKHGYDDTLTTFPRPFFVYAEVNRGTDGGDTHLLYPLAYLDRLFVQEQAAGRLAHPEWYDTRPRWAAIATRRYDELKAMKVGANTQSYGFYGYEMVYPADYFKVMQDTLGR